MATKIDKYSGYWKHNNGRVYEVLSKPYPKYRRVKLYIKCLGNWRLIQTLETCDFFRIHCIKISEKEFYKLTGGYGEM